MKVGPISRVKKCCILNNIGVQKIKLYTAKWWCIATNPFLLALGGALTTIYSFTNTHSLIKGCLNEDLLLVHVFIKRRMGLRKEMHIFDACCWCHLLSTQLIDGRSLRFWTHWACSVGCICLYICLVIILLSSTQLIDGCSLRIWTHWACSVGCVWLYICLVSILRVHPLLLECYTFILTCVCQ